MGEASREYWDRKALEQRIAVLEQQLRDAQEANSALIKRIDAALDLTNKFCKRERKAA